MATDETCQTYSVEEFAAVMGISRAAAYRLTKSGEVPHFRLGTTIRISKHWVAELLSGRQELRQTVAV